MVGCPKIEPDLSYYKVDRDIILDFKPIERRLSCNFLNYDYPKDEFYNVAIQFVIKNFYSLFNYISNEFTPNLIVKPDTMLSFNGCDHNIIQLGAKILAIDGLSQQMKVDALYSIMIHEMFHKRYTNCNFRETYLSHVKYEVYYDNPAVKKQLDKIFFDSVMKDVFNILEDYRIEKLGMREFPGYVFFFDQCRKLSLEIHVNKKPNELMLASFISEYIMFRILLPELLSWFFKFMDETYVAIKNPKHSKGDILKIINNIDNYITNNLKLVYSDNILDVIHASKEIHDLIPKKILNELNQDIGAKGKGYTNILDDYFFDNVKEIDEDFEDKLPNIYTLIDDEINKAEKSRNDSKSKEDENDKYRTEKLNTENSIGGIYENCIIYNPKCRNIDQSIYNDAKRMAMGISRNLGFLASRLNQTNNEFELIEGELDEDELYSIGFSNNIFYEEESIPGFEFDFGILVDESGSMSEKKKINNAILASLGIILSVKDSKHVNLFVYGHSQGRHRTNNGVELYEYYNSKRKVCDWRNIFAVTANGNNADGYAIEKVGEIMLKDSKARKKILIVISDGMPHAAQYRGEPAEQHVMSVVNDLENKGIEIIQICIDNIDRSNFMFKHYIPFDTMGNFVKKLGDILQKKLIKFASNL